MHGGQHHPAAQTRIHIVFFRAFQSQISDKGSQIVVPRRNGGKFLQPLPTARPVIGVEGFQPGAVMLQNIRNDFGRTLGKGAQRCHQLKIGKKLRVFGSGLAQGGGIPRGRHVVQLARSLGAYPPGQGGNAFKRRQIQRVQHQPGKGQHILDMRSLGVAQAAVFAKGNAQFVQLHFQMVRLITRAEQHGDFLRAHTVQQFGNAPGRDPGLREIAQRPVQAHGGFVRVFTAGEQALAIPFGSVFQQGVGHIQHGLD